MTSIKTEGAIGSEPPAKYAATGLPPRMPIFVLDVGCGIRKQPGAIGIDRNPASRPDVLVDLDQFPFEEEVHLLELAPFPLLFSYSHPGSRAGWDWDPETRRLEIDAPGQGLFLFGKTRSKNYAEKPSQPPR